MLAYYMVYLKKKQKNDFLQGVRVTWVWFFSVINKCFMHSAYTVSMPYRSNAKLQLKFFTQAAV